MNDAQLKMPTPKSGYIELAPEDFAALGVQHVAYVKPVAQGSDLRFEIHADDGTAVALMDSIDVALAAVRQHGLEPLRVH